MSPTASGAGCASDTVSASGFSDTESSILPPISFLSDEREAVSSGWIDAKAPLRLESLPRKPRSAAPATRLQAAPAMHVVTSQRLVGRTVGIKGTVMVAWEIFDVHRTACNPRNRRELSGQLPHAPDQKLVPLTRTSSPWRLLASTPLFPIRCSAGPRALFLRSFRRLCLKTARNLPSAWTQVNPVEPGSTVAFLFW